MKLPAASFITDSEIASRAADLRADFFHAMGAPNTPAFPIRSLVIDFLEARDHVVACLDALGLNDGGEQIAGSMAVSPFGGAIKVDRRIAATNMLPFTLAHEVGHWILHAGMLRRRYEQEHADGEEPRLITLRRDVGGSKGSSLEWQANRFAVHLLMPADLVGTEFVRRYGTTSRRLSDQSESFVARWPRPREYSAFMASKGQSSSVAPLMAAFGVSTAAMAIRLKELALV